jgi:hypothetical protein
MNHQDSLRRCGTDGEQVNGTTFNWTRERAMVSI